jgi:hypothetical protein
LESSIYVLIYSKMAILYEVYRKMPKMNVTILLLCNYNQTSDTGQELTLAKLTLYRQINLKIYNILGNLYVVKLTSSKTNLQ